MRIYKCLLLFLILRLVFVTVLLLYDVFQVIFLKDGVFFFGQFTLNSV